MPSPFQYACFVSYCHGQHALVKTFVQQFKQALEAELEPLLEHGVYIDFERLEPGFRYNDELGVAICRSLCMVVIYSPTYEDSPYCLREFEAMVRLESQRVQRLPGAGQRRGLIIPVVLRGADSVPPQIRQSRHYLDFSQFSLASAEILRHPEYAAAMQRIASTIYEHHLAFRDAGVDVCEACDQFRLPAPDEVPPWRAGARPWPPAFPSRS